MPVLERGVYINLSMSVKWCFAASEFGSQSALFASLLPLLLSPHPLLLPLCCFHPTLHCCFCEGGFSFGPDAVGIGQGHRYRTEEEEEEDHSCLSFADEGGFLEDLDQENNQEDRSLLLPHQNTPPGFPPLRQRQALHNSQAGNSYHRRHYRSQQDPKMTPRTTKNSSGLRVDTAPAKAKDDKKQKALKAKDDKIAQLKAQLAAAVAASSPTTTSESGSDDPKKSKSAMKRKAESVLVQRRTGEKTIVIGFAKETVWKERPFVNSEDERDQVFAQMLQETDLGDAYGYKELSEEDQKPFIRAFAEAYEKDLIATLNDKRSSLGSQLKTCIKKARANGLPWPVKNKDGDEKLDTNRLRDIVLRKNLMPPQGDELTKAAESAGISEQEVLEGYEENQKVFDFWWEELVPRTAGNKNWGKTKRYNGLLSTLAPEDGKKPFVSSAHEAITFIAIVNGWMSWIKSWKSETELAQIQDEISKKSTAGKAYLKRYDTKWSLTDGGHNRWGGFSQEGRTMFARMRVLVGK